MNLMTKEEMKQLILETEGFEIQTETEKGIVVYDHIDNRFLHYRYLEDLDVSQLFQFNSFAVNQEAFYRVINDCFDKHMFMVVKKIIFVNNREEYEQLLEEYPEQFWDIEQAVGVHFFEENVIIINAYLIRMLVQMDENEITSFEEELSRGVWETLIHELRHSITENPIIPETMISIEEGGEEQVEAFCRKLYQERISKHPNVYCFQIMKEMV